MKKGLIRTCIYEYIDANDISNPQQVFDNLQNIYKFLREHPNHGDVLPSNLTFEEFTHWAKVGFTKAVNRNPAQEIFENLKRKFNRF